MQKILREKGPVTVPREFVFMDRAAIGLGCVFLHLDAHQRDVVTAAGVPLPEGSA